MEKNPEAIQPLAKEEEAARVFNKFDSNGDGKISPTELAASLNALGSGTPADEVDRIMSELDTDGDGFIDLKEFKAFHFGGDGADADEALKEAFNMYDEDKDGKISAKELQSVLHRLGEKCSVQDCQKMISSVDVDGDEYVNFEEFKQMMVRAS